MLNSGNNWAPENGKLGKRAAKYVQPFIYSSVPFAIFIGFFNWNSPCFPGNLGFNLLDECRKTIEVTNANPIYNQTVKAVLILAQMWIINFNVANGCYFGSHYLYTNSHCITNYLRLCQEKNNEHYLNGNSLNGNAERYYKRITLLANVFSQSCSTTAMFIVTTNTASLILSISTIMSMRIGVMQFIFLFISTYDRSVLIKEIFGIMADLYTTSQETLRILSKSQKFASSINRRVLRSLKPVRIKMGEDNYFDKTLIGTNADFIFNQVVSVLLTVYK